MIVTPDFLDNPKTVKLVHRTGDKSAPLVLLRLWAHCQTRRRWEFPEMTTEDLGIICRWDNKLVLCHESLLHCRFIDALPDGGFRIHNWEKVNSQLVAAWSNGSYGKLGGRNPTATRRGTVGNPSNLSSLSYLSDPSDPSNPSTLKAAKAILAHLNKKTGRKFVETDDTLAPIATRLQEVSMDTAGIKKTIDRQCTLWIGGEVDGKPTEEFLCIKTLFGDKFHDYYSARDL